MVPLLTGAVVEDLQYKSSWACRAILKESRSSVNDVEFAPRHLGLKLVGDIGLIPSWGSAYVLITLVSSYTTGHSLFRWYGADL